ncbi:RimK family alpha-L-glutamate ligase [Bacillus sp. MUM 13]|uniref:ATP-grasp domain-containing protein n=1 Tax=Bacillus sp. MUM 13 TaxID=1678001 RepID=UPI001F0B3ED3|nr:RimK family alpha-L-glutamate ligase [Bacillus sp. MUM 13]
MNSIKENFVLILANEEDHLDHTALSKQLNKLEMDSLVVDPRDIITMFDQSGTRFYLDKIELKPSAVLGWVFEDILQIGMNLLYAFERSGIPVVNKADTLFCGQNKYLNSEALHRNNVPHFPVISGFSEKYVNNWTDQLEFPLVHKQIVSAGGQSVMKVEKPELLTDLARTFARYNESFYAQPYFEKPNRDIRVICIDYKATTAFYKYTPEGEWVTNVARGGKPIIIDEIEKDLASIAERAAKALGAQIAGVDLLEDPETGYRVLEVNTCPNFSLPGFMEDAPDTNEFEIAKMLVKLSKELVQ